MGSFELMYFLNRLFRLHEQGDFSISLQISKVYSRLDTVYPYSYVMVCLILAPIAPIDDGMLMPHSPAWLHRYNVYGFTLTFCVYDDFLRPV